MLALSDNGLSRARRGLYFVFNADFGGPTVYSRCRTLQAARRRAAWLGGASIAFVKTINVHRRRKA